MARPDSPNYPLEKWPVSVEYARAIVQHFYACKKHNETPDPRTVSFIDEARERYCKDQNKNRRLERALGLVPARGNPGRVATGKRQLTEEAYIQAGERALELADDKTLKSRKMRLEEYAAEVVAQELGVSPRTVRSSVRDRRMERIMRTIRTAGDRRELLEKKLAAYVQPKSRKKVSHK
jgi:hypothetical protein